MFKVFKVMKKRRREVITERKDLLTLLTILDEVAQETRRGVLLMDMEIGRCDIDDDSEWFVQFDISNKNWSSVIDKLEEKEGKHLILKDDLKFYLV